MHTTSKCILCVCMLYVCRGYPLSNNWTFLSPSLLSFRCCEEGYFGCLPNIWGEAVSPLAPILDQLVWTSQRWAMAKTMVHCAEISGVSERGSVGQENKAVCWLTMYSSPHVPACTFIFSLTFLPKHATPSFPPPPPTRWRHASGVRGLPRSLNDSGSEECRWNVAQGDLP